MKQLLLFACLLFGTLGLQAQVYVDADATGANDGTTWADAYTDPNTAFANAPTGSDIWVAEGTYTIAAQNMPFFIDRGINVIGGFSGTETSADESDPTMFETVFSGDVDGNDGATYDSLAYTDNGRVFLLNDTATTTGPGFTIGLSNLTIANGGIAANAGPDDNFQFFAGGGILSYARLDVDNVTIRDCRAGSGSAMALLFENTAGSRFKALNVENNETFTQRTIYLQLTEDIEFSGGVYTGPFGPQISGMFVASDVNDFTIRNATIAGIDAQFTGGALRFNDCDDVLVEDCMINDYGGGQGGAIYIIEFDGYTTTRTRDVNDYIIRNTTISDGVSNARGGAISMINNNLQLDNVNIENVQAADLGGAIYVATIGDADNEFVMTGGSIKNAATPSLGGAICNLVLDTSSFVSTYTGVEIDSSFAGNSSRGGIWYHQVSAGANGPMTLDTCTFTSNVGGTGGGLHVNSSGSAPISVDNTTFSNNSGDGDGGAIFIVSQGESSDLTISNSTFSDNSSTNRGGAITIFNESADGDLEISNTVISGNTATSPAGAIFYRNDVGGSIIMDEVTMEDNVSESNGGGVWSLSFAPTPIRVTNSTFEGNAGDVGGAWWATETTDVVFRNCDFISNGGVEADGPFQGGALVVYGAAPGKGLTIDSCDFRMNSVAQRSGILSGGGVAYLLANDDSLRTLPLSITNNDFGGNTTIDEASGGALFIVNGWTTSLEGNRFFDNGSGGDGGAINFVHRSVRDTLATGEIQVNFRGLTANLEDNIFSNNTSASQGGAISTQSTAPDFINNVFVNNSVTSMGASGGAIIINGNSPSFELLDSGEDYDSVGALQLESFMIHNTFFNNRKGGLDGAVGETVALFQPGETEFNEDNSLTLTLLNNAFVNSDGDVSIEIEPSTATTADMGSQFLPIGDLTVNSLGGNFFAGEVGIEDVAVDSDTEDETVEDDVFDWFTDPEADFSELPDLSLIAPGDTSAATFAMFPLINHGVSADDVPETDLRGLPRVVSFKPDAGAYENQDVISSTANPIEESGLKMSFFPNPTQDVLNITNETSVDRFHVLVADNNGRVLGAQINVGVNSRVDFTQLPAGIYNLQLILDGQVYSKQIVKQ